MRGLIPHGESLVTGSLYSASLRDFGLSSLFSFLGQPERTFQNPRRFEAVYRNRYVVGPDFCRTFTWFQLSRDT